MGWSKREEEIRKEYPYNNGVDYRYGKKNNKEIQLTILTKEKLERGVLEELIFTDYYHYINEHRSAKVSKNNMVKFLNDNGVPCVNREHYK